MKRIMTVMLAVIYITTGTISVMAGEPENNRRITTLKKRNLSLIQ